MRRRLKKFRRCFFHCQYGLHATVAGLRLLCTSEPNSHMGQMAQSMAQDSQRGFTLLITLIVGRVRLLRQWCFGSQ